MNQKKIFTALTALTAVVFFAACSAQENIQTSQSVQTQSEQGQTQMTSSTQAGYSGEDKTAYQDALQAKDASKCGKISNDQLRQTCTNSINDQTTLSGALSKGDPSLCVNLSTPDLQQNCKTQVEARLQSQQQASQQQVQVATDGKLRDQIIANGDYTQCSQIQSSGFEYQCEVDILSAKAKSTNDTSWCQKGSSQDIINACVQSLTTVTKK